MTMHRHCNLNLPLLRAVALTGACFIPVWLTPHSRAIALETDGIQIFPAQMQLSGPQASGRFVVQRAMAAVSSMASSRTTGPQVRDNLEFQTSNPDIARVVDDRVLAVADGSADLIVERDGHELGRMPIVVTGTTQPQRWQFEAHVQSVLARQGCNSGACHGALAGKGGFRLSLLGYDSQADHFTLTRQDDGRRVEPADPGRSLLLAKPSMLIPHKGGLRLDTNSNDYRLLAEWIASGAPGPASATSDAPLVQIEVLPKEMQLAAHDKQQLIVLAHYQDGRSEDVTHWAKFSSSNEVVARVAENGEVEVLDSGKGAIAVWFGSRIAMATVIVPFQRPSTELVNENQHLAAATEAFQPANFIDEILLDEWRALELSPSPTCSDETFLRRAFIDATGTIPTPDQVGQFLGDHAEDRRRRLIDKLLASTSYVDYWSYQWSNLLLVNSNLIRPEAVTAFYTWIRQQVELNTPWDEFARQIVLAKGESTTQGATNFYAIHQDPESLTENTCQAFMGLSIGCAKCHNHPLEKWTNDQYYAMANLFARVRAKGWGGDPRNGDGQRTLLVLERGDLIQPSRGRPQPPTPLDATPLDIDAPQDRRIALADWLTSADNPYFARAIANRIWAAYMGVGLVEAVDDLRVSNPASSERLLNALAEYLAKSEYDTKALARLIMNSQTYQRSSQAVAGNVRDQRFYGRYYPRRLMAEVLHDAVVRVTGVPTEFKEIEYSGSDRRPTNLYPAGTDALELYDAAVVNTFLKTFGRHQRRITCDCERSDQPTVVQVLHLNNGDTLNDKLSSEKCVVQQWISDKISAAEAIDQAYLSALSRYPSADERNRLLELIRAADQAEVPRTETFQDLLWGLMTSREFLFAH
jgi:hypothetical protein